MRVSALINSRVIGLADGQFPANPELAYGWITTRNRGFDQLSPAEVIRTWGFAGLLMVRAYLDRALTQ